MPPNDTKLLFNLIRLLKKENAILIFFTFSRWKRLSSALPLMWGPFSNFPKWSVALASPESSVFPLGNFTATKPKSADSLTGSLRIRMSKYTKTKMLFRIREISRSLASRSNLLIVCLGNREFLYLFLRYLLKIRISQILITSLRFTSRTFYQPQGWSTCAVGP